MFRRQEIIKGLEALNETIGWVMKDMSDITAEVSNNDEVTDAFVSADVAVVNFMGSESGIYLAWKYNVTLAFLIGQQVNFHCGPTQLTSDRCSSFSFFSQFKVMG